MNRSDRDPDAYDRIRDDKLTSDFAEPMFGPAALVTVAQWNAVMADDQREGEPNHPVTRVNVGDCRALGGNVNGIIINDKSGVLLDIAWPRADGTYNLSSANLFGANLFRANLSSANLREADLREADLSSADLSSANLFGADLREADLSSADLSSTNLFGADLREADLSSANLFSADLSSANLCEADLREADLSRANLSSASLIDLGQDSRGYRFVACAGEPYMIAAGCRWLALAEAKAHWKNNAEARLKIELCEKEAKRRGWVK